MPPTENLLAADYWRSEGKREGRLEAIAEIEAWLRRTQEVLHAQTISGKEGAKDYQKMGRWQAYNEVAMQLQRMKGPQQ